MPRVRVPRKNVTADELVTVLSRRLGDGYQVRAEGPRQVTVRRSSAGSATVSIADSPGASVFRVRGGLPFAGTARRVADVLRRSPEFRGL